MRAGLHSLRVGLGLWLLSLVLDVLPAPERKLLARAIKPLVEGLVMCNGDYTAEGFRNCPIHGREGIGL